MNSLDKQYRHPGARIRVRVAGFVRGPAVILLQKDRCDDFWALPGGEVEPGETSVGALHRELDEELGWQAGACDLRAVHEQSFDWRGQQHFEIALYFDVALSEPVDIPDQACAVAGREPHLLFRWTRLEDIEDLDLRPAILRELILTPSSQVCHYVG